ncbi:MAG: alpha-glucosidase C-terminal domain-containing protein [Clostridia bacterium]|nr:alpha-glucosidase C-terminal domain-containing protein [Clostridia bacterium]
MEPYLFHSRRLEHRDPFGAVVPHTPVRMRVRVPREWGCRASFLIVLRDDRPLVHADMFWAGMDGDSHEWWECHFEPQEEGLYFYTFQLHTDIGIKTLSRRADGSACLSDSGLNTPFWQLTCYAADFKTPDWLAGGVMYQIFPDRFARSSQEKQGVPADRVMHGSWDEPVRWQPDEQGRYHNNDYYGGDLKGIEERLDYLKELGVTCIYLNPIFEAHSNHRYNTASYRRVDPLLGTEEDLRSLVFNAATLGIRVMLDGVFSHTGSDSEYFNRENRYEGQGAFQSPASPYYNWFQFRQWPQSYASWWGFDTLPEVNETEPSFMNYINGEDGIVRHWLRTGLGGWRLDVADELPDAFLDVLRSAAKAEDPDAVVLGEVWEDASNKHSYGHRRRYLLGRQLDSVMNYPFADAVLGFLRGGTSDWFCSSVETIVEHYPPQVTRLLMNHIGTHDTERALTVLAGEPSNGRGRPWQASKILTPEERERGLRLMRLASALQFCLPGVPCIYYGDEAGAEGYRDPFNRAPYPWGREDRELIGWYRQLGKLRRVAKALPEGSFRRLSTASDVVCFERADGDKRVLCAVNRSDETRVIELPILWHGYTVNLGGGQVDVDGCLTLPPLECAILIDNDDC